MMRKKPARERRVRAAHFRTKLTSIKSNITPTFNAILTASESGGLIDESPNRQPLILIEAD
jgi:hypothetical protein